MIQFKTNGTGYWSNVKKKVTITDMVTEQSDFDYVIGVSDNPEFGELMVYFDTDTWDVKKDGLIYTDKQFLKDLRAFLDNHGLPGADVHYSEQGMQGNDYVSLDVGADFLKAWATKFNIKWTPTGDPLPFKNGMDYMTH